MPRLDSLETTKALTARGYRARVIVLTTFDTDDLVLTAMRHGAVGFLLKDTPPADLVDAVRRVAAGESTLSPSVTAQLIATGTAGTDVRHRRAAPARDPAALAADRAGAGGSYLGLARPIECRDRRAALHGGGTGEDAHWERVCEA